MIQELRFVRMNTDVAGHDIKPEEGEYRMMENLAPPQRGKGVGFVRESLKGTVEIPIDIPAGVTFKCIGSHEDAPNNRMIFFIHGDGDDDYIFSYDANTKTTELRIASEYLEWTENTIITGISLLDNVIYWTDPELKYYRIQDKTQLISINYYARAITDASTNDYYFQAESEDETVAININVSVTGPKTASQTLTDIAALFNADPSFSAHFFAEKLANSEVIVITALTKTGNWRLTNNSTILYYYYATNYDPVVEGVRDFTLYPIGPVRQPIIEPAHDPSIIVNNIGTQNWQFAYRYIYTNNQISVFSAYSEFWESAKIMEDLTANNVTNRLQILLPIVEVDKIKSVELAVRTSQTGDFFIVKTFKKNELFIDQLGYLSFNQGLLVYFTGTEVQIPVATADMIKQQEGQPRESIDLQLMKNKLFVLDNLTGFDVDPGDFEMAISIEENGYVPTERYFKDAGRYTFGIRYFDEYMRTDGTVHKSTEISFSDEGYSTSGKIDSERKWVEVTLSGKPPIWANYYSIVRSDEQFYQSFIQAAFYAHYWVRPMEDDETYDDFTTDAVHYAMWGQVYLRPDQDQNDKTKWKYVHLQQPTNLPFLIQRGNIINLGPNFPGDSYATVLDTIGPMVVIDQPTNATIFANSQFVGWYEVFEDKKVAQENSFYEVGDVQFIYNAGEANRKFSFFGDSLTLNIYGDCFYVNNIYASSGAVDVKLAWKYDWGDYTTNGSTEDDQGIQPDKYQTGYFESYSPSFRATQVQLGGEEVDISDAFGATIASATSTLNDGTYTEFGYDFGYMNSQEYATRNLGRPAVLLQNSREEERASTLRWSNDFVDNAYINGLHTFEVLNEYPLPLERGDVMKLQKAGEDVLLAIHSTAVTSMYIGKGIIRSADLNPTLITTDSVIGVDNELKLSYGTVHPESVCEVDGNVYYWDGTRNEPVRYGQNGLTPIASTFATRVFFKDTIPATFGNSEDYKCYSQYDRLLNMVFFTFKNDTESMTIGFHETSKAWIGKFGFAPEYYGVIGDQFIGFLNGVPWLHNEDNTNHNTFYGTHYPSKATFIINQGGHLEKAWDGMMVDSKHKWDCPMIHNNENQVTNLLAEDFVWRDQVYYADFLRDMNTDPQLLKPGQIALRHGKFLSSQIITVEMELDSSEPHYLHSIAVASTIKAGHMIQQEK